MQRITLSMYTSANLRSLLEPIVRRAIQARTTPGAVVLVGEEAETLCLEAFGHTVDGPKAEPVSTSSIYDAASVTKAASTVTLLMHMVARGEVSLSTRVSEFLPHFSVGDKREVELRHLAGHASGLPAHQLFYERIWSGDLAGCESPRDALVEMAARTELSYRTGSQTLYSDLGYILLARILEIVAGRPLEGLFQDWIASPLEMEDTQFVNLLSGESHPALARVVPTESSPEHGLLHGEVHDDNARSAGGVCGHAGLFTTAEDLARLARALCLSYRGESDFLSPELLSHFWSSSAAPGTTWKIGWDSPSPEPGASQSGDLWPKRGVGHLGFTGTCMWLDPPRARFVVLLTNRVYYSREKSGIKKLRRALIDAIVQALEG